jgi:hypothetical protein
MGWIGVDLDGTLAVDDGGAWGPPGAPVPAMVALVKAYRAQGHDVRIFTARVTQVEDLVPGIIADIEAWSLTHLGEILPITATKDTALWRLYDDRAVQVEKNTGRILEDRLAEADAEILRLRSALIREQGRL